LRFARSSEYVTIFIGILSYGMLFLILYWT